MNPQGICGYRDFCASSECNKCKANRTLHYLSVFRSCCGCPTLLLQKKCQIVYTDPRKWMKSNCKFLDQDFDVVFLANKGILVVIRYFVGRNYDKILMETGKLLGIIRVTKNVFTEWLNRRILRLQHHRSTSSLTSSFLAHCLAFSSHAFMIISKFWCHENETGSLYFERNYLWRPMRL